MSFESFARVRFARSFVLAERRNFNFFSISAIQFIVLFAIHHDIIIIIIVIIIIIIIIYFLLVMIFKFND